tara:strand:- start:5214 stop:5654 length:441 start_codon:yes stop_codon:yes gene_type:complete
MTLLRASLFAIALSTAAPSLAQATPETIANSVLRDFKKGDATVAINNLLAKAPLLSSIGPEERANLIDKLDSFFTDYGKIDGWQLLNSSEFSNRYVGHTYIIFQEDYAINLNLKFYRSETGWAVTGFSFDSKIDDLLDTQSSTKPE